MHEASLAMEVLETLERVADAEGFQEISRLRLRVGALSGVEPRALVFALEGLASGTLLEGADLELIESPGRAFCPACDRPIEITFRLSPCPLCGYPALTQHEGTELIIEDIETRSRA